MCGVLDVRDYIQVMIELSVVADVLLLVDAERMNLVELLYMVLLLYVLIKLKCFWGSGSTVVKTFAVCCLICSNSM